MFQRAHRQRENYFVRMISSGPFQKTLIRFTSIELLLPLAIFRSSLRGARGAAFLQESGYP